MVSDLVSKTVYGAGLFWREVCGEVTCGWVVYRLLKEIVKSKVNATFFHPLCVVGTSEIVIAGNV